MINSAAENESRKKIEDQYEDSKILNLSSEKSNQSSEKRLKKKAIEKKRKYRKSKANVTISIIIKKAINIIENEENESNEISEINRNHVEKMTVYLESINLKAEIRKKKKWRNNLEENNEENRKKKSHLKKMSINSEK